MDFLSYIIASPGNCHTVKTKPKYRRCGLATELVRSCLTDEDVIRNGGIDANTNGDFSNNLAEREYAKEHCATIVYLQCQPEERYPPNTTPNAACVLFLDAAFIEKYDLLFTVLRPTPETTRMDRMTLDDAIENFEGNADDFINSHGRDWYLCREK